MNATADLFEDHSAEQAATEGGFMGRRPSGGRDAAPPASEAVIFKESAPVVPEAERSGGDAEADQIAAQGLCNARRSQTPSALNTDTPREREPAVQPAVGALYRHSTGPTAAPSEQGTVSPEGGAAVKNCGTCREWSERPSGFGECTWLPHWTTTSPRASCHFTEAPRWAPIDAAASAKREAQRGIDQAVEAQERRCRGWSDRAFEFVKQYAAQNKGRKMIGGEIVAAALQTDLPVPENLKAWGHPLQRAARAGVLVKAGYAPDPKRHNNPVPLWECA